MLRPKQRRPRLSRPSGRVTFSIGIQSFAFHPIFGKRKATKNDRIQAGKSELWDRQRSAGVLLTDASGCCGCETTPVLIFVSPPGGDARGLPRPKIRSLCRPPRDQLRRHSAPFWDGQRRIRCEACRGPELVLLISVADFNRIRSKVVQSGHVASAP